MNRESEKPLSNTQGRLQSTMPLLTARRDATVPGCRKRTAGPSVLLLALIGTTLVTSSLAEQHKQYHRISEFNHQAQSNASKYRHEKSHYRRLTKSSKSQSRKKARNQSNPFWTSKGYYDAPVPYPTPTTLVTKGKGNIFSMGKGGYVKGNKSTKSTKSLGRIDGLTKGKGKGKGT